MPGKKTHEQQVRMFERKPDLPKEHEVNSSHSNEEIAERSQSSAGRIGSEAGGNPDAVQDGLNQETRDHNKHNHQTQKGHGRERPSPEQEKD